MENSIKGRFLLTSLLVVLLDHLTKYSVSSTMRLGEAFDVIPGYLRIAYARNFGVAFGYFNDPNSVWRPYLLGGLAAVAVVVILVYSSRMSSQRVLLQVALAVTMGGILGNFIDRILRGSVVDFIEVHFRDSFHWPTFNVADSAITVGIAMLLIDAFRHPDREEIQEEMEPLQ